MQVYDPERGDLDIDVLPGEAMGACRAADGGRGWPGGTNEVSPSCARVVMLTPDREQVDRRILLQAHSLSRAGYRVTVAGLPSLRSG